MANGIQDRPRGGLRDPSNIPPAMRPYYQPGGQPYDLPGSQNIQINIHPGMEPYAPCYRSEVVVKHRGGPGIVWTLFQIAAGLALLAVIVIVLLTGLGAVMANLGTTGGLPQPVVDWSTGLYRYFFK